MAEKRDIPAGRVPDDPWARSGQLNGDFASLTGEALVSDLGEIANRSGAQEETFYRVSSLLSPDSRSSPSLC